MMTIVRLTLAGTFVFAASSFGYAQTPTPAMPKPTVMPDDAARKAKAKECSLKADAQGLHGKARKEFREKCKKS